VADAVLTDDCKFDWNLQATLTSLLCYEHNRLFTTRLLFQRPLAAYGVIPTILQGALGHRS